MDEKIFKRVGLRLKQARELKHITLEEAGKKADVHKSTVLRWENGETEKIKVPVIEILAEFYNVNPTWLMGYDVPMQRLYSSETNSIPLIKKYEKDLQYSLNNNYIKPISYSEFTNPPKEYFALRISDDSSMAPLLDLNDIAIIHLQSEYKDRQTCLIELDGKVLIRKIYILENTLELHAMNPYYPVMIINKNEFKERKFKVIGSIVKAENQSAFK